MAFVEKKTHTEMVDDCVGVENDIFYSDSQVQPASKSLRKEGTN
jgi:hypothetical protein